MFHCKNRILHSYMSAYEITIKIQVSYIDGHHLEIKNTVTSKNSKLFITIRLLKLD